MGLASALTKKASFHRLGPRRNADGGSLRFQAYGDGFYPLIRDGDILHLQSAGGSALAVGDLVLCEPPGGSIALRLVLRRTQGGPMAEEKTPGAAPSGNRGNEVERLVGRVAAIERQGRPKRRDRRLARLSHLAYFGARPLLVLLVVFRKALSLLDPKFFVRSLDSSLRSVAHKHDEPVVVSYYSERASEGLDEDERTLVERYMGRRGRVLDIGCGAGREAFALAQLGFEVVGVDVAVEMIAEARRHAEALGVPVRFEVMSATDLDLPPRSFDYVLVTEGVYSLIPTRRLRIDTLARMAALLAPGGRLFVSPIIRRDAFLARVMLYSALRRIAKPLLGDRLRSEPGDVLVPYILPVGNPSKPCYLHIFKDSGEVDDEIASADLEGFEDGGSGYWVVGPPAGSEADHTRLEATAR